MSRHFSYSRRQVTFAVEQHAFFSGTLFSWLYFYLWNFPSANFIPFDSVNAVKKNFKQNSSHLDQ